MLSHCNCLCDVRRPLMSSKRLLSSLKALSTNHIHQVVNQWLQGAIATAAPPPLQAGVQSPPVPHPAAGAAVAGQPPAAPSPLAAGALAAEGAAGGGQSEALRATSGPPRGPQKAPRGPQESQKRPQEVLKIYPGGFLHASSGYAPSSCNEPASATSWASCVSSRPIIYASR